MGSSSHDSPLGDTDYLKHDLKGRSVRGSAINLFGQSCKFILNLGGTAILARLLTPSDFGILAMVMAIVGFVIFFRNLGLSMATVQWEDIRNHQINTLFWVNLGFGLVIFLITWAVAPGISWLYGEPRLTHITLIIAIGFIFGGLTGQHQALLHRHMRYKELNTVEILSLLGGVGVGVFSAIRGWGYWSLVFKLLSEQFFLMAGMWLTCGWRPGRPAFNKGVRSLLQFGGNLAGVNILFYLMANLDKFLIGTFYGTKPLGFYSLAYKFLYLPIQQINFPFSRVALPALSRLQDDIPTYRLYYRKALHFMVGISLPLVVFLLVTADHVVQVFLGSKWLDSVILFRLLGPAALLGSFGVATRWVFVSLGQTDRQLRWTLFVTPITVLGLGIGLYWGPVGVAASLSITRILLWFPGIIYCFKTTPLKVNDVGSAIWRPVVSSALSAAVLLFWIGLDYNIGLVWKLVLEFFIFSLLYIISWVTLPGGKSKGKEIVHLIKELDVFTSKRDKNLSQK